MTRLYFPAKQTWDPVARDFARSGVVQVYAVTDTTYTNPLPIYDLAGVAISNSQLIVQQIGQVQDFQVDDQVQLRWKSGAYTGVWESSTAVYQKVDAAVSAASASASSAASAVTQVQQYIAAGGGGGGTSTWTSLTGKPSTFPPSDHTHPTSQISDATTVGRAVMSAADAQTARAAIGAGTGNGTSNLTLGSTGTTAAAGNHSHQASAIPFTQTGSVTATNVQDAIAQAASTGGGSGTSSTYVWKYSSGAYPTLPSTQPTGVLTVDAQGPTQPTVIPSWIGTGASQATLFYRYAALT